MSHNHLQNFSMEKKFRPSTAIKNKINSKYSLRQKEFNNVRPVREYKRFISFRKSSGAPDKFACQMDFNNKDAVKPLIRQSLYDKLKEKNQNYKNGKIKNSKMIFNKKYALGTTVKIPNEECLPKKQQFYKFYFPKKNEGKKEFIRRKEISTDHISIRTPRELKKVSDSQSFLKMKAGFSVNKENKEENQWAPYICQNKRSLNNISSKNYDIINFRPLTAQPNINCQILNGNNNKRQKGIAEFSELNQINSVNYNKDYAEKLKENPNRFHRYNGIFTYMYDMSSRNGNIILPFDLKTQN